MTIQELTQMEYPLGMPRAWLFTPKGDALLDGLGRPIARYLEEFEYIYDEESDDICNLSFRFPNVAYLDIPYFQNDVVLIVQWGFVLPNGESIKSPKRKIAVRDLRTRYSDNGYELKMECSDLVAYLKGYNTQTITKYGGGAGSLAVSLTGKAQDNFLDFIKEIKTDQFVATVVTDVKAIRFAKNGGMSVADYDQATGEYKNIQKSIRNVSQSLFEEFTVKHVSKGKSKSIRATIEEYMRYLDNMSNGGGNYIMDSTGDSMVVRRRNFDQKPFKTFRLSGEPRDLTEFDSNTDTRRIEQDIISSSGIDPFTKETDTTEVGVADTSKKGEEDVQWRERSGPVNLGNGEDAYLLGPDIHIYKESSTIEEDDQELSVPTGSYRHTLNAIDKKISPQEEPKIESSDIRLPSEDDWDEYYEQNPEKQKGLVKPNSEMFSDEDLDKYVADVQTAFIRAIKFPDETNTVPDLSYGKTISQQDRDMMPDGFYSNLEKMTIPAKTVLSWPGMMDRIRDVSDGVIKESMKENLITGHALEKIQRKFEASATMLGDPSLIKGRTYNFFNLSRRDSGKWYAKRVSHKMSLNNGYICEMELLRKPKPVGMASINYRGKRELLTTEEKVTLNEYISTRAKSLFPKLEKQALEEVEQETDEVQGMQDRVQTIDAEEDFKEE